MRKIYLICGVPGAGKTWVASQLSDKYDWLPHDEYMNKNYVRVVIEKALTEGKPLLIEAPFAERVIREDLEKRGFPVNPVFIIEDPKVVKSRYESREHREVSKSTMTRAITIRDRAIEWNAPSGNSNEILNYLKAL